MDVVGQSVVPRMSQLLLAHVILLLGSSYSPQRLEGNTGRKMTTPVPETTRREKNSDASLEVRAKVTRVVNASGTDGDAKKNLTQVERIEANIALRQNIRAQEHRQRRARMAAGKFILWNVRWPF